MTGKVRKVRGADKYKPEFNKIVVDLGMEGKSMAQIAAALNVDRKTVYNWTKNEEKCPGFGEAMARAKDMSQAFWEEVGYKGITGQIKGFKQVGWIYTMKCRFNQDWSEVKKSQVDINNRYTLLTDDELNKKLENYKSKMLEADKHVEGD